MLIELLAVLFITINANTDLSCLSIVDSHYNVLRPYLYA